MLRQRRPGDVDGHCHCDGQLRLDARRAGSEKPGNSLGYGPLQSTAGPSSFYLHGRYIVFSWFPPGSAYHSLSTVWLQQHAEPKVTGQTVFLLDSAALGGACEAHLAKNYRYTGTM